MHSDFWHERWRDNRIGFHADSVHPMLVRHWPRLGVDESERVFVPLCGKSLDMAMLRDRGHEVVGVEISAVAIESFFGEQEIAPSRDCMKGYERWYAPGYDLLVGDFFTLDPADLGPIGAAYDRAALIALPPEMRARYAQKMQDLLPAGARVLLITLQHDTPELEGPPFCVRDEEVGALFGDWCDIERIESGPSRAKGHVVDETALLLSVR